MIHPRVTTKVTSMMNLATARGGLSSNLATIAYLPSQKRLSVNEYVPERKTCKFKRGKRVLGTTQRNLLDETMQERWRSCVKIGHKHSMDQSLQKIVQRSRNAGKFHSNNQTTLDQPHNVLHRSVQDLGVYRNRKRVVAAPQTNPILFGTPNPQKEIVSKFRQSWKEPRRHRDNGDRTQRLFNWVPVRKQSGYTEMFKKKLNKG